MGLIAQEVIELRSGGMRDSEIARRLNASRQRINQIRNPLKHKARCVVLRAVKTGKLKRPNNCERCEIPCKPSAHHADYSKPLDVTWLCNKCHARVDMGINEPCEMKLNIRIPNSLYDKLKMLADSQFRSMNSTVTLAILEKWERDMEKKSE